VRLTAVQPRGRPIIAVVEAASSIRRGVRRVSAIDVEHRRALEWSVATGGWELLGADAAI